MIGLGQSFGNGFAFANDVIARLEVERARGVGQQLRVTDDDGDADA